MHALKARAGTPEEQTVKSRTELTGNTNSSETAIWEACLGRGRIGNWRIEFGLAIRLSRLGFWRRRLFRTVVVGGEGGRGPDAKGIQSPRAVRLRRLPGQVAKSRTRLTSQTS